jgi:hypothetical protein
MVLKEIHGLGGHDNIPEKLIPPTFSEENSFLDANNILILKPHYMKCYLQIRKELLDHLKDFMIQDSLVGPIVNTRSKKGASVVSRMPSPSVKSVNTKTSKSSEASKPKETSKMPEYYLSMDFFPINQNHAFMPKPDFEGTGKRLRSNMKVIKNSMRVAQTFWMKIYIKCQITKHFHD